MALVRAISGGAALALGAFAIAAATPLAFAQPADQPDTIRPGTGAGEPDRAYELPDTRPSIEQLLARLDDRLFGVRERATFDLVQRGDFTLGQAERAMRDPALSPEQRLRLASVAFELFIRGPRAAMGIRFGIPGEDSPALVDEPQPGFHAMQVLRRNDRIIEADGMPIGDQEVLRAMILSHSPGETMPLKIQRAGELIETELTLGSFADLQNGGTPRPSDLLGAWRLRRARSGAGTNEESIVPAPAEAAPTGAVPERDTPEWRAIFATADAPESLVIGGQTRQSTDLSLGELAASDAARARLALAAERGQSDLDFQAALFRRQRQVQLDQLASLQARLGQAGLRPAERLAINRSIDALRAELAGTEQQIRALERARINLMRP